MVVIVLKRLNIILNFELKFINKTVYYNEKTIINVASYYYYWGNFK